MTDPKLSEKWIKASIAATIWAASEIVLGSFLHNLKVPFSGNILTAIGLIILISISYIWTERGLFWRAGLICALMKTLSPSAVIFGPMIAIFSEAILIEFSVRLLGRTLAGYLIGSMLAMSWNLFQKIVNYIIFYGSNIIEVYNNLLSYAQKQFNIQTDIVWLPIIMLLIIYALFGLLAGVVGIRVGRKMLKQPVAGYTGFRNEPVKNIQFNSGPGFAYSITWLLINAGLIIIAFILLNRTSWIIWSATITGIIVLWSFRYKKALRQLAKPKFWFFFVFITLITAFAFTKAYTGDDLLKQGLLTGFQMNFRAAVIMVGFSVLGTELYNPVIRNFFTRTSFRNLPLALELSVESLPSFIAYIPDFRSLLKNPVSIFHRVISQAEERLTEIKNKKMRINLVIIITGIVGGGKTTYAKKLVDFFRKKNYQTGGILAERVMVDSQTIGYDLVNIETGEKEVFLRQKNNKECGPEEIGRFKICSKGYAMGNKVLGSFIPKENNFVIIDEVGRLELSGMGWSEILSELLTRSRNHILITVRNKFLHEVIKKWNLENALVVDVSSSNFTDAELSIIEFINRDRQN